jgi:hypothetical protein
VDIEGIIPVVGDGTEPIVAFIESSFLGLKLKREIDFFQG